MRPPPGEEWRTTEKRLYVSYARGSSGPIRASSSAWWGPPTYPATFTKHDLAPGSRVEYHMTGPEGDQPRGYWDIVEVDAPRRLIFRDGFANDDGTPNDGLPSNEARVAIEDAGDGRTRMSIQTTFASKGAMEQVLAMGMEEGLTQSVGQIDAVLSEEQVAPA
jgi:uncharacterized protein YndB with AHSA1/START domain